MDVLSQDALEVGRRWLSHSDLRPTRQRLLLAALLKGDGRDRHVTAEWLHDAARRSGDKVSLATVYNTLRAFTEAGLVQEITVDGAGSIFDTRTDDHAHFYFEGDGALADAGSEGLTISNLPDIPSGMEVAKIDVVIRLRPKG
ncbi:transcriptional repressor [Jannaschia sp. Os4]|uniref:iron response transcriptional regulator IrrA n=1 Tax=Jannaschia sp. Os4 TaxID=2807617 RepID=UPI0019398618|nr:transcriptional repressor [Jannaschia sp. Os4]MBM2575016.1 transcriptional repressor [Jannaschia sp. Os4]